MQILGPCPRAAEAQCLGPGPGPGRSPPDLPGHLLHSIKCVREFSCVLTRMAGFTLPFSTVSFKGRALVSSLKSLPSPRS